MSHDEYPIPQPSPQMQKLERLVGTWEVTGGAVGRVTYSWMEGRFFLKQEIDLNHDGHRINGLEIIGHEMPFGGEPSEDVKSRYYGSMGETFDYVYEMEGDTLTIWGGMKGSPAYFKGAFDADGTTMTGGWVYPDGGGYQTTMTKIG